MKDIFKNLIVLDMANNHNGDFHHAVKIIDSFGKLRKKYKLNCTIKFQFRNLDTFIHPEHVQSREKFIRRFLDNRLNNQEFLALQTRIKKLGFLTSCTPFDEDSVTLIEKMKFDILKIASASARDFNLLERVTENTLPKIISTGSLNISEIDKIVSYMKRKKQIFAIMHCVAKYPSNLDDCNLKFIKKLKERYVDIPIGWSTHEDPNDYDLGSMAYGQGASIFEKHINIKSKKHLMNDYSIIPEQFEKWILKLNKTSVALGDGIKKVDHEEIRTIKSLSRGVYSKKHIFKNELLINKNNIFFAIPLMKNQVSSNDIKPQVKAEVQIKENQPLKLNDLKNDEKIANQFNVFKYVHKVRAILNENKINLGENFDLEISHHYGLEHFHKYGCYLFNILNKKYAKKIIVCLPNQKHPAHFHKKKEESFFILSGELTIKINKKLYYLKSGDVATIPRFSIHEFKAGKSGCIFDEISTKSFTDDSFYLDKNIKKLKREDRKTFIQKWY